MKPYSSLLFVLVRFFSLDCAQIAVATCLELTEALTNRNVSVTSFTFYFRV